MASRSSSCGFVVRSWLDVAILAALVVWHKRQARILLGLSRRDRRVVVWDS